MSQCLQLYGDGTKSSLMWILKLIEIFVFLDLATYSVVSIKRTFISITWKKVKIFQYMKNEIAVGQKLLNS